VTKIVSALNLRISPRDLKSKDTRNLLTLIMQQWLPLSTATFQSIVDVIPPPDKAQSQRLPLVLYPQNQSPQPPANDMETALYGCVQDESVQVVGYISKMFAVGRGELPEYKPLEMTAEEMRKRGREERERRAAEALAVPTNGVPIDGIEGLTLEDTKSSPSLDDPSSGQSESFEVLLGFTRMFAGTLKRNTNLLAILPKFNPDLPTTHPRNARYVSRVKVKDLYMMMGRELVAVEEVPAGHVCAVGGLEGVVHRNATLWGPDARGLEEGKGIEGIQGGRINLAGVAMQVSFHFFRSADSADR
jgi:ribosome assembly protein 1